MTTHKILIVDDDPDMALALHMPLEASGYQVFEARSGQEGLQKITELKPDLILLDAMMETNTAGFQLSLTLRSPDPRSTYSAYRHIPILMVTAIHTTTSLRFGPDEAYLPVDDFVEKPVDPDVLLAKVQTLLAAREEPQPVAPAMPRRPKMAKKQLILVVDDDVQAVDTVETLLQSVGYETAHAYLALDGMELARQLKPDLILLDVMFAGPPGPDGFEVSRELHEDPELKDIPVIILSGLKKVMGIAADFTPDETWMPVKAFLEKPVKPADLLAQIEKVLGPRPTVEA